MVSGRALLEARYYGFLNVVITTYMQPTQLLECMLGIPSESVGVFIGAIALGFIHGIEPGHGWPVAAAYALEQSNKWIYGFLSSFILGVGHLISSIAMVGVFFFAAQYFDILQANDPITILGGIQIGGPIGIVAGIMLIALGIHEYESPSEDGHGHDHGGHDQSHDDTHANGGVEHVSGHSQGDNQQESGFFARVVSMLPFVGDGHSHSHDSGSLGDAEDATLWSIASFALVLGFVHEEEFEIIALCAGSAYCLELMLVYALTVIFGIVGLTLLLVAGYEHYEERVERIVPYLPAFSAAVLIVMGLGFLTSLL